MKGIKILLRQFVAHLYVAVSFWNLCATAAMRLLKRLVKAFYHICFFCGCWTWGLLNRPSSQTELEEIINNQFKNRLMFAWGETIFNICILHNSLVLIRSFLPNKGYEKSIKLAKVRFWCFVLNALKKLFIMYSF